jgi:hypothetical protein
MEFQTEESASYRRLSKETVTAITTDNRFYRIQGENLNLTGFKKIDSFWSSEGKYTEATSDAASASFNFTLQEGFYTVLLIPPIEVDSSVILTPTVTRQSFQNTILILGPPKSISVDEAPSAPESTIQIAAFVVQLKKGDAIFLDSFSTGQKLDYLLLIPHINGMEPKPNTSPVTPQPSNTPSPQPSPTPQPSSSPRPPTFTQVNSQILMPRCATSGCHDGVTKRAGYSYANYADTLRSVVVNNATGSPLYDSVSKQRMPFSPKLTTTEVNQIRDWINAGAPNN